MARDPKSGESGESGEPGESGESGVPGTAESGSTSAPRLTADELALRLGVDRARVEQLADRRAIERDADGRFARGDVHRVRLLNAFEEAGVPLDALLAASRAGMISLTYYDELHPPLDALSGRTYADLRADMDPAGGRLAQLFAAFGLAEPDPGTRLTVADDRLVCALLEIVEETGQPDLALRAVRMYGESAGAPRTAPSGCTAKPSAGWVMACRVCRSRPGSTACCGPGRASRASQARCPRGWAIGTSPGPSTSTA